MLDTGGERITDLEKARAQRAVGSVRKCLGETGSGLQGVAHEEAPGLAQRERVDPGRQRGDPTSDRAGNGDSGEPDGDRHRNGNVPGSAHEQDRCDACGDQGHGEGGDHGEKNRGFETTRHSWGG